MHVVIIYSSDESLEVSCAAEHIPVKVEPLILAALLFPFGHEGYERNLTFHEGH